MISTRALSVLAGSCLVSGEVEPNFHLFATEASVEDAPLTCYPTPSMPPQIEGTYIVSGPARWHQDEYQLQGLFDGFGKANKFVIGGGQVCHASKWMNTSIARVSEEYGHGAGMLFEESQPKRPMCPMLHPMCESFQMVDNNWVNVIEIGGRVMMLSDSPHMLEVDLDTLDIKGNLEWGDDVDTTTGPAMDWATSGHVVATGSAHPIAFPGTNTVVDVVTEVSTGLAKSLLGVYTFQSDATGLQNRTMLAQLPFTHAPYLHSFGITDDYIILPISQKMGIPSLTHPVLLGLITMQWEGIYVLDKAGNTVGVFKDMDPFVHVHVINSFQVTDESGIRAVIDLGGYPDTPFQKSGAIDIPMFLNKTTRDSNPGRANLMRITMYLSGDKAGQSEVKMFPSITNSHIDFYKLNPTRYSKEYCHFYATEWWHDGSNYANMAIVKQNVCDDTYTHFTQDNFYPGEAYFIPTGEDEDDGALIVLGIDGNRGASSFITIDPKTMTEVDGTRVDLPFHIPFTAHGEFISKSAADTILLV